MGSGQNETGDDGIRDTPFIIDESNQDHYPLIKAWNWSLLGDINYDFTVDMKDVDASAKAFGTVLGDADWNPRADITGPEHLAPDRKVDMRDVGLVASHFGETYP